MITENIKSFTDEEIINLINKIVMGEVEAEISDLKAILAEASGRKLEKNYINIIADRIREKIQPEKVEQKRKVEVKEIKQKSVENTQKFNFDDIYNTDFDEDEEEDEDEKYPVLSFLSGLYKVFAWILFVGIILTGALFSVFWFKASIIYVCIAMFTSVILSLIFLLVLLGLSESIKLKIDIEKHLRNGK